MRARASGEAFLIPVISVEVVYYVRFELLLATLFFISGRNDESLPLPYPPTPGF
jgi:hypothetical protein